MATDDPHLRILLFEVTSKRLGPEQRATAIRNRLNMSPEEYHAALDEAVAALAARPGSPKPVRQVWQRLEDD